jgi:hypothetical protein
MPPWLAALVAVGAVLLTINVLPSLAAAITPNRGSDRTPTGVSAGLPSDGGAGGTAHGKAHGTAAEDRTPASGGTAAARCPRPKPSPAGTTRTPTPSFTPRPDQSLREDAYDRARTYGVDPSKLDDSHSPVRAALVGATKCTDPLPKSGASLERAELGAVLLAGGLALLMMIGFKTDRPWPGRYVRRSR